MSAGEPGSWPHCIHSQDAQGGECLSSVTLLLFIQPGSTSKEKSNSLQDGSPRSVN